MGFKYFSTGSDPGPGNPNPNRFKLLQQAEFGDLLAVRLHYEGCTNYEGQKILVLRVPAGTKFTSIDPHFTEDGPVIARFCPTEEGWQDAIDYCGRKTKEEPKAPPEEPKKVRLPKTEVIYAAAMARSEQLKGPLCPICDEPQHDGDCR